VYDGHEEGDSMGAYERLGVRPVINATCHWTIYGGSVMWPEVIEAMAEARHACVDMRRLLDRASEVICRYTHAEASYVVSGCAAALQAGAAAILTGDDPVTMAALPHPSGLTKTEFIIRRFPRRRTADDREYAYQSYAQAVAGAGGTFVEVGSVEGGVERAELDAAFGPSTAGVYWTADGLEPGVQLDEVVEIAHARGVPVLVDASNVLPPPENLHAFVELGADLVAFSGGKGLRGPQGSGILTGRADLIRAARAQCAPEHGVGRPLKVSKEEIVGLVTALECWAGQDHAAALEAAQRRTAYVVEALAGLPGVRAEHRFPDHRGRLYPTVFMHLDPATSLTGKEVVEQLLAGEPSVAIMSFDDPQIVRADVRILSDAEAEIVAERLRAVLSRSALSQGVPAV
jgi:L-seryl-tRNA(Ser) seleniumtransferase